MKTSMLKMAMPLVAAICATSAAMATDLENYYFRYDFSDGTKQFTGSASQASDPVTASAEADKFVAAYGQDGAATAVHVTSTAYGSDKIAGSSTMNNGWTVAMSLRPGSVNKGLLFSIGKANANNSKCVFVASSDAAGKLYAGTVRKKGSSNNYTGSVDRELAKEWELTGFSVDTTTGYHTIVIVHAGSGIVDIYCDGELAGEINTTDNATGCTFGNGIQFNQAHGSSTFLSANGYSQSLNNPDVAFQDVRFYNSAFTAKDAAAYAALYPATLPGFSNLDQYAYVQSYGVNGVDTGVYMTDTDKFTADFAFTDVSYKSWLCGAGKNANKQTHAIYLNGSKQLAWTTRGEWWSSTSIVGTDIKDKRLAMTVESSLNANLTYYDDRTTNSFKITGKTATSTGPSIIPTHLFRANTMMDGDGQACKAKIYSFEVDANSSAIVPRAFFAPTTDANGAAGFTNVVAGTFHGECQTSPSTALTFTSGVGRAEDYRYRSGKFYSRIYASSADSAIGLVKFDGGDAGGTNAQFTARGKTAKIIAVPAEGYTFDRWEGDTWAITSGSATSTDITVKSDTAIQLRATFVAKSEANAMLTVAADGVDSLNWSEADWRDIENPEAQVPYPTDKDVTIVAHKSFTLTLDAAVTLSNLTVRADTDCVVTLEKGVGSLVTVETTVESGVLKLGTDGVLGASPLVTVKDGATFDFNGKVVGDGEAEPGNVVTEFHIAGAGAGDWPWALTSSADMSNAKNVGMIYLDANATIGGAREMWMGVRNGAGWNYANKNLNLNGFTLTKTGTGTLQVRRPYSGNEGTIDVQSGTLRVSGWSNANAEYGQSCVSNIALVVHEGVTAENSVGYPLYFKTLDCSGGALKGSSGGFGMSAGETLAGHGTAAELTMADGVVATLDGNLDVTTTLTANGALSFVRKTGVETNVTVAATGTLTATNVITVGAGVIFNIGANRPEGTLSVDGDATLVLRQASASEEEIVVNVSSQPQNIVVYDVNGNLLQDPEVTYNADAGTLTVGVPSPHWKNNDGTGSLDSAANWTMVPTSGGSVIIELSGDTAFTSSTAKTFGQVSFTGEYSADFTGAGTITLSSIELNNVTNLVTGGKLKFTAIAIPQTCTVTITGDEGLADGGLSGKGTLVIDPCAGSTNTITMTTGNTSFTGEAVIKSGTVKFGAIDSFGPVGRAAFIRVKNGAVLDENKIFYYPDSGQKLSKAILEEGATLQSNPGYTDNIQYSVLTTIKLEGNATVDTSSGNVTLSERWHDHAVALDLGTNTLTVTGNHKFGISYCTISGTGTIDVQSGATIMSTHDYGGDSTTTCADGTILIRDGAIWNLANYQDHVTKLSVKDLILDGSVTRAVNTYTLTVTGSITGNGTTPMLKMGSGAVFKPSGTGYLNITASLSGTLKLDLNDLDLSARTKIPLVKVPTALAETAEAAIDMSTVPKTWKLKSKEANGSVEYCLSRPPLTIILR